MNIGAYNCGTSTGGVLYSAWTSQDLDTMTLMHGMDRAPDLVGIQYYNYRADNGYNPDEMVPYYATAGANGAGPSWAFSLCPGQVVAYSVGTKRLNLKQSPGSSFVLNTDSWKFRIIALWFAPLPASL